ncbi:MAG TPA: ATP-binding cassette domain-containing protein [Flavobacterium sp.]|jgi:phospholipid/cholesterol/gamma-HCH transport system ATP-binding protein
MIDDLTPPTTPTVATDTVIEISNVQKRFGDLEVLKDISLTLKKQENLVVLGKSGTGKSVLIKCIVRLLDPDSGSINVFGTDVTTLNTEEMADIRKRIGFLFQSGALYDSMTVKDNLEFPLRRIKKGLTEAEISAKVMEALENVGLPEALDKMPSELSGGMRKRISLARTIIVDPEIMLYDEPTTGLDPVTSHEISILINEIQKKYKTASIIITHDIECARTVADRFIMLKEGEVYKDGSLQEFEASDDPYISSFFSQNQNIK